MSKYPRLKAIWALLLVIITTLSGPFVFISFHEYLHCQYSWHIQGGTSDCVITFYNNGFDGYAEVYDGDEYMGLTRWEHPIINTISLTVMTIPVAFSLNMFWDAIAAILYGDRTGKHLKRKRDSKKTWK